MSINNGVIYIILFAVIAGFVVFYFFINPNQRLQQQIVLKSGSPDTIRISIVDTVWKETKTREIIRIKEEKIIRFNNDSSRFDTTITDDNNQIRVTGTTFPAIDSLRLEVASIIKYPEISGTDTIKITTVDTLKIQSRIEGLKSLGMIVSG